MVRAMALSLTVDRMDSPVGGLVLVSRGDELVALAFEDRAERALAALGRRHGEVTLVPGTAPAALRDAVASYFGGAIGALDALRVRTGGTPFQQAVWQALRAIPAGTTTSYARLARAIGRPSAVRAVGLANGSNPVAIVVPCHRVIGEDGSLTGYGGGLERKRWLLAHERASPQGTFPQCSPR
jgi:methylated-DNA-[protein]-cysteine S-methyltransferase